MPSTGRESSLYVAGRVRTIEHGSSTEVSYLPQIKSLYVLTGLQLSAAEVVVPELLQRSMARKPKGRIMVNKSWLNVAGLETARFAAIPKGEEKFAFLYAVISAVAVGCAMTFGWIVGLVWWQAVLLVIGCLIGAWATLFSFLEMRRLDATPEERRGSSLGGS